MPAISVVIPTLNEARHIEGAIASAGKSPGTEILVVDGGSMDETKALAESRGVRVLSAPRGRARQMNVGAVAARGEVLIFLHADSRLPEGYPRHVFETLGSSKVIAGAFELSFDGGGIAFRVIETTANWRARFLQLPYGDQGVFVGREVFFQAGGFPDFPIMEDVALIRRLNRKGRIAVAPSRMMTSPRRYEGLGVWRRTLLNKLTFTAFLLGIPGHRIAAWYAAGCRPPDERTARSSREAMS